MKHLQDIPKHNMFKTPEGYFDALGYRIKDRIDAQKPADIPVFGVRKLAYIISVSAVVILSVWLIPFDKSVVDPLSDADIYSLVEYDEFTIEEDIIEEYYASNVMTVSDDNTDDEVIDYLINDNIDFDLVENDY